MSKQETVPNETGHEETDWKTDAREALHDLGVFLDREFDRYMRHVRQRMNSYDAPRLWPIIDTGATAWVVGVVGYVLLMEYAYFRAPERWGAHTIFADPGFFMQTWELAKAGLLLTIFAVAFLYWMLLLLYAFSDYLKDPQARI